MKRSREIASEIKRTGDKRSWKAVAEAEKLVSLRFYFCVVRTNFLLMRLNSKKKRDCEEMFFYQWIRLKWTNGISFL